VTEIRRQGETHRAGPDGTVGPPPSPPAPAHRVRSLDIRLDVMPDGGMRVSTPQARGWAVVASGPRQLLGALQEAFTEAQVAAYSRWKGEPYELDALTEVDNTDPLATTRQWQAPRDRTQRTDVPSPADWTQMHDGRWRSPGGRFYRDDCETVKKVLRKRRMLGETA
jgi:hypothetical protein